MSDCFSGIQVTPANGDNTQNPAQNPVEYFYEVITDPFGSKETPNWLIIALAISALIVASYFILRKRRST